MENIMTQLDLLAKNFIGACSRREDVVGIRYVNPKEANFEEMYNEEVNFLANTISVCHANYPRLGVTQGVLGMRDGEIVIESGGVVTPLGKRSMFLCKSIKSPKISNYQQG